MAIYAIGEWLNGDRDYYKGVELYKLHGSSDILKATFEMGKNSYTVETLEEEMLQLYNESEDERPATQTLALPTDILTIEKQAKDLFKEMAFLHANLDNSHLNPTDAIRLQSALRIRDIHHEMRERFKMVDHFRETGQRLEVEEPVETAINLEGLSPVELLNRRNTLRTHISKLKKKIESNPPANKLLKWQGLMQKHTTELEAVNLLL
jgi:hypothetical protein